MKRHDGILITAKTVTELTGLLDPKDLSIEAETLRRIERYETLLRSYQKLLVENADIKDQLLQKDKMIDHYEKLWKSHKRGY